MGFKKDIAEARAELAEKQEELETAKEAKKAFDLQVDRRGDVTLPNGCMSIEERKQQLLDAIIDKKGDLLEAAIQVFAAHFDGDEAEERFLGSDQGMEIIQNLVDIAENAAFEEGWFGLKLTWNMSPDQLAAEPPKLEDELLALLAKHGVQKGRIDVRNGVITANSMTLGRSSLK